jgi:hypothetical protein
LLCSRVGGRHCASLPPPLCSAKSIRKEIVVQEKTLEERRKHRAAIAAEKEKEIVAAAVRPYVAVSTTRVFQRAGVTVCVCSTARLVCASCSGIADVALSEDLKGSLRAMKVSVVYLTCVCVICVLCVRACVRVRATISSVLMRLLAGRNVVGEGQVQPTCASQDCRTSAAGSDAVRDSRFGLYSSHDCLLSRVLCGVSLHHQGQGQD